MVLQMCLNFLAAAFILATGLVILTNTFSCVWSGGLVGMDTADIFAWANLLKKVANTLKPTYHVPAGPRKPACGFIYIQSILLFGP